MLYVEMARNMAANTTRQVQLAVVSSLHRVMGRLDRIHLGGLVKEMNKMVTVSLDTANYSALRIEALKVLVLALKRAEGDDGLMEDLRTVYALRVEEFLRDQSPEVKSLADQAKRLLMSVPTD